MFRGTLDSAKSLCAPGRGSEMGLEGPLKRWPQLTEVGTRTITDARGLLGQSQGDSQKVVPVSSSDYQSQKG